MWQVKHDGRVMAHGQDSTFPSNEKRKSMERAGYKVYVDGKIHKEKERKK